jgi:hypothetical protein
MNGIYLTPEGKQEIEAKIAELEKLENDEFFDEHLINDYLSQIRTYKEILSSATILPVEESWDNVHEEDVANWSTLHYPQGVIIQPKQ